MNVIIISFFFISATFIAISFHLTLYGFARGE